MPCRERRIALKAIASAWAKLSEIFTFAGAGTASIYQAVVENPNSGSLVTLTPTGQYIAWRESPTFTFDIPIGFTLTTGIVRVTLADSIYNPDINANAPMLQPIVTIAATAEIMEKFARQTLETIAKWREIAQ